MSSSSSRSLVTARTRGGTASPRLTALLAALLALGLALAAACAPAGAPAGGAAAPAGRSAAAPASAPDAPRADTAPASPAAPEPLQVGLLPGSVFQWGTYAAMEQGFYTAEGIAPDVIQIGTPNDAARAVVSNSVPVAHYSVDAAVRAIENGGNLVVVGSEISNPAFSLIVQPEIPDYAGLRGKSIAVSAPKDGAAVVLRLWLRTKGLGEDDYDFASVGTTPNRYAALKTRAADAAIMTQPLDFKAMSEGFRLLGRSTDVLQQFVYMNISANKDWAREHRAELVRYLRGLGAGIDWLYDPANKEAAIQLLMERTKTDHDAVSKTYTVYIEEGKVLPRHAEVSLPGLETFLKAMVDLGDLPATAADPLRYVDPSFVEEAKR
ncbi:MAG TPA: ABC transporter substrate-binding protein [Chloroflexota bacterium]|jgi:ABC-type nitrate/sulfonate/bicarbonate transport system substrate-binding protein